MVNVLGFFLSAILMSGVCLFCIRIFSNWVCWVRGNFSGGPGPVYISCLYLFAVRLAGRYNFYLVTVVEWTAGLYRFFFFSGSIAVGTVRVKW